MLMLMICTCAVHGSEWRHLSTQDYLEKRFECEARLLDDKWARSTWPADNRGQKPTREQVMSDLQIQKKVSNNLQMESALESLIGVTITSEMLQADIDRMLLHTRDGKKLNHLFALLGGDARTVAECLSRPNLVLEKMQNNYWMNDQFHAATYHGAVKWLQGEVSAYSRPDRRITIYHNSKANQETINNLMSLYQPRPNLIALSDDAFAQTMQEMQASEQPIIETRKSYTHSDQLEVYGDFGVIHDLVWYKRSFEDWWRSESLNWSGKLPNNLDSPLAITSTPAILANLARSSLTVDVWESFDIPTARYAHTAVWTGTEMLIWGGQDGGLNTATNTGSRYDPVTDTWTAMSLVNAPLSRYQHTAVWTGSEMIVWGGLGSDHSAHLLNTGSKYNPITNTWQALSTDNVISPRRGHRAIWTGSEMFIWGGNSNEGGLYDPAIDQWQRTNIIGAPIHRLDPAMVWTGEKVIIWGGEWSHNELDSGAIYDPQTNTWSPMNTDDAPSPRTNHAAVWTGSEMLVWGGDYDRSPLRNGKKYNPQTDAWTDMNEVINPPTIYTFGDQAVWTGNKMLLWYGHLGGSGGAMYDPQTDDWQIISRANEPGRRGGYSMVWTGEKMLLWGGEYFSKRKDTGGIYDPQADHWVQMKTRHEPLGGEALWTGVELIVWGKSHDSVGEGGRYDPILDQWTAMSKLNAPHEREGHELIWTGTEMMVWGGDTHNVIPNNGRYEPLSDSWVSMSTVNQPDHSREDFSAVWTGNQLVVWGGRYADDIGGFYGPDSDQWQAMSVVDAPPQRYAHSTVWTGSEMIIWGGYDGTNLLNDGAKFNPVFNQWTPISTENAPQKRRDHSAIWTGTEMMVTEGDV